MYRKLEGSAKMMITNYGSTLRYRVTGKSEGILGELNNTKGCGCISKKLSPKQEALLFRVSNNKDQIRKGEIEDWQKEFLEQSEEVMMSLQKKYPSYSFTIVDGVPLRSLNPVFATFYFYRDEDKDKIYTARLYMDEDGNTSKDNFYSYIIEKAYTEELKTTLREYYLPCEEVVTNLVMVQGDLFCESMNVKALVDGNIDMPQVTYIYFNEDNLLGRTYDKYYQEVKVAIYTQAIYGTFEIISMKQDENGEPIFKKGFNSWEQPEYN